MNRKILVVGAGKSGIASSKLLKTRGEEVTLYDGNKELDTEKLKQDTGVERVILSGLTTAIAKEFDLAVFSPGIPLDCPDALIIKDAGVRIIGEIELGYLCGKGSICAITGTNGKTTTTALTGELLKNAFDDVRVVGNIGNPFTGNVSDTKDTTIMVAEISSFQLETVEEFAPKAAAILNITPDHLNRHHTMEAYIAAKERIAINAETVVLNYDDDVLRDFGEKISDKKNVIWFSSAKKIDTGYYLEDGVIKCSADGVITDIINVSEMNIIGTHNHENAMAAIALSFSMGADVSAIQRGLRSFVAVAHRIEFAGEKNGVKYYDDSKATNTDAAIKGICAMSGLTYLIGGGYDKGGSFKDWIECFDGRVKKLLLIGVTKDRIKEEAEDLGFTDTISFETMEEAFDYAAENAVAGENVLLSPACASWDMFKSYEQRGDIFKELVRKL